MYTYQTETRIRYGETDQMGYCYYGNYALFLEVGRVEALRNLGITYKSLENTEILLPVLELNIKYFKPAFYDDLITIKTTIAAMPNVKIFFDYEIYNEKKELLTKASTTLVFVSKPTMRPTKCPENLIEKLKPYFD
ncbi:acyl-CoA thioesterase [Putridiphycobacter roseus]|uniref:Acyl-CoA thioesterase n=1 Tax=Putridiphycobacter roseus TaxID=2219161 RepID=A0A2W1N1R1_9FLAO|nr:thioesterase family protein [Putridiphycobacter roseus]PZE18217.1 acyl-CoA thioesterase [Putridiphycobacter roseus]